MQASIFGMSHASRDAPNTPAHTLDTTYKLQKKHSP